MVEMDGKMVQVIKSVHGAGQGRQLGNVQASFFFFEGLFQACPIETSISTVASSCVSHALPPHMPSLCTDGAA